MLVYILLKLFSEFYLQFVNMKICSNDNNNTLYFDGTYVTLHSRHSPIKTYLDQVCKQILEQIMMLYQRLFQTEEY